MYEIVINGISVKISIETKRRLEKIAAEKKITVEEAVSFCLQKVI